jgi:hypothetical protein
VIVETGSVTASSALVPFIVTRFYISLLYHTAASWLSSNEITTNQLQNCVSIYECIYFLLSEFMTSSHGSMHTWNWERFVLRPEGRWCWFGKVMAWTPRMWLVIGTDVECRCSKWAFGHHCSSSVPSKLATSAVPNLQTIVRHFGTSKNGLPSYYRT